MANDPRLPPNASPGHLIRPLTLRILGIVLVVILIGMFPARELLRLEAQDNALDRMAILYGWALLKASPENLELRTSLARRLMQVGDFQAARELFVSLEGNDDIELQWLLLELDMLEHAALEPTDPSRSVAAQHLAARLANLENHPALGNERLARIADQWLAMGHPGRAAGCFEHLAERDPEQRYRWLTRAGTWWLKAGDPQRSAAAWHRAWQLADDDKPPLGWLGWVIPAAHAQSELPALGSDTPPRREAAIEALLAAEQSSTDIGVEYAREYLSFYPDDPQLLDIGIRLALAHGQPEQALEWSRRYLDGQPDNIAALERHVAIALGLNRAELAIDSLTHLRELQPQRLDHLEGLARAQIWAGQPQRALTNLDALARASGQSSHDREVVTLAISLHQRPMALAALGRLESRGDITLEERRMLVDLLEYQGDPDAAIARIQGWQASGINDPALARRRALWLEQAGREAEAEQAWQALANQPGTRQEAVQARGRLLAQRWELDAALAVLATSEPTTGASLTNDYWRQRAELAWLAGDAAASSQAYRMVNEQGELDDNSASRLIQAAADSGDLELAMAVTRQRWANERDTDALVQMFFLAQRERRPDLARALLALADEAPERVANSPDYWGALGGQALQDHRPATARAAYERALALDGDNPSLRAGMLFALAAGGDRAALRQRLVEWQSQARGDSDMTLAMAEGHRQLGELDRALRWMRMADRAGTRDPWRALDHADLLSLAGQRNAAFEMRRRALADLLPTLARTLEAPAPLSVEARREQVRAMTAATTLSGPDSALGWYRALAVDAFAETPPSAEDSDWLFDAHQALQQPAHARYLLLRARDQGHESPTWQTLTVALDSNDKATLRRLLEAEDAALSGADRLAVLRQLDRREEAMALAQELNQGGHDHRRDIVELANQLPHRALVEGRYRELGELSETSQALAYERAGERWWGRLDLIRHDLDVDGLAVDASGLTEERDVELTLGWKGPGWNGPRNDTRLTVGMVDSDADSRWKMALQHRWQATARLAGTAEVALGQTSDASDLMRLLGQEDSAALGLEWQPTARDTLSLDARHLIYRSREERERLGDGYRLESEWRHALIKGATRRLDLRLLANHQRNDLKDTLPADSLLRLPTNGLGEDDLLADRSTFIGAGISLSRGEPGAAYPDVASPRLSLDLETGYRLPDRDIGFNAGLAVGTRLFGNDELSLRLELDQGTGANGDTQLGAVLTYQLFLGRPSATHP
ncbi:tetratricopeptide repeat protein [Halomonas urumqiensis]|uniref:tetratricopeptide repeat protein n=1 Tax=Halomonas urumqiensis TaxID=1684789 RepID=UPI0015E13A57|nr:tetratricopeptide repeat protein [Halomonas urumqiensis]GHE21274.1 hypothetical protein GCM10017767_17950 [Halomonas urumqiensis]